MVGPVRLAPPAEQRCPGAGHVVAGTHPAGEREPRVGQVPHAARHAASSAGSGSRVHDDESGDGPGQHDVEAAQALLHRRLGGHDRGRLDHDDVVVLQSLGQRRRHHGRPARSPSSPEPSTTWPTPRRAGHRGDVGVGDDDADRARVGEHVAAPRRRSPRPGRLPGARSRVPGFSRTDSAAATPGAMCGSSRLAKSRPPPAPGSRGGAPRRAPSGLPRCCRVDAQSAVAHGVVPWARSPSTVAAPVEQRRPTARSCIGDRSCASSSTTWPRLGSRSTRSAASSTRTASASDQGADFGPRAGLAQSSSRCSSSSSTPSAARGQHVGVAEQRHHDAHRVDRGPEPVDHRDVPAATARDRVLHPVVGRLARLLHLGEQRVRQPLREHRARRAVADVAALQLGDELGELVGRHPPAPRPAREDQRLGRRDQTGVDRAPQDRRHPRVALERRDRPPARRRGSGPGRRPARRASPGARRPRRGRAGPPRCRRGRRCWGRRPARRRGAAGRGTGRGGTPPGAGRPRSCRCPARPARRWSRRRRRGR